MCGHGLTEHGLVMELGRGGWWLNFMILKVFSYWDDSVIPSASIHGCVVDVSNADLNVHVGTAEVERCAIMIWIHGSVTTSMTVILLEWQPMDCSVPELKFYPIISFLLSCHGTDCDFKVEGLICGLKYAKMGTITYALSPNRIKRKQNIRSAGVC